MKISQLPYWLFFLLALPLSSQAQLDRFHVGITTYRTTGYNQAYIDPMVDMGFSLVMPGKKMASHTPPLSCNDPNGPNPLFLDLLHDNGMEVWLPLPERVSFWRCTPETADPALATIDACYYSQHPAITGFPVTDEPTALSFDEIDLIEDVIQGTSPDLIGYTNLLSAIANYSQLFQTGFYWDPNANHSHCQYFGLPGQNTNMVTHAQYEQHVDDFLSEVQPRFFSADFYPFWTRNEIATTRMFMTLDVLARKGLQYDVPFGWVPTPMQLVPNPNNPNLPSFDVIRDPAFFRYQLYAPMMYGAKSIVYWARETTTGAPDFLSIMDQPVKTEVGDIHKSFRDHSCTLMQLEFEDAYHYHNYHPLTTDPDFLEDMHPNWQISNITANPIAAQHLTTAAPLTLVSGQSNLDQMAISFLKDSQNGMYFWVMNKSVTDPITVNVNFNGLKNVLNVLDDAFCANLYALPVSLLPGEARLFQVSNAAGGQVCDNPSWSPGDAESFMNLTFQFLGSPSCSYTVPSGVAVDFKANETTILGEFCAAQGSEVLFYSAEINSQCGTLKTMPEAEAEAPLAPGTPTTAEIQLVPNPSTGDFRVLLSQGMPQADQLEIWNLQGKKVYARGTVSPGELIQPGDLPDGLYFVKVYARDQVHTARLLLQQ